jgi:hypothetical protein
MYKSLGITIKQSEKQARLEAERLAAQRRITEAEVSAKSASMDAADLQRTLLTWAPRVIGGMALVIAAYLFLKKRKGK